MLTDKEEKEIFPTPQDQIDYWATLVKSIAFLVENKAFSNKKDLSIFECVKDSILYFHNHYFLTDEQQFNLKVLTNKIKSLMLSAKK